MTTKPAAEPSREVFAIAESAFEFIRLKLIGHVEDGPERLAFWKAVEARDALRALRAAPAGNADRPTTEAELLQIITRARGKWASNPDPSNKDSLETFIARELSAAGVGITEPAGDDAAVREALRDAVLFLTIGAQYAPNSIVEGQNSATAEMLKTRGLASVMRSVAEQCRAAIAVLPQREAAGRRGDEA